MSSSSRPFPRDTDQVHEIGGTISICSPDHIGLLIHKTFNVSIPRHHIPVDQWEFEYGTLENDPEHEGIDEDDNVQQQQDGEDGGRWVHKKTGEMIGGPSRQLEFTIIGSVTRQNPTRHYD